MRRKLCGLLMGAATSDMIEGVGKGREPFNPFEPFLMDSRSLHYTKQAWRHANFKIEIFRTREM